MKKRTNELEELKRKIEEVERELERLSRERYIDRVFVPVVCPMYPNQRPPYGWEETCNDWRYLRRPWESPFTWRGDIVKYIVGL